MPGVTHKVQASVLTPAQCTGRLTCHHQASALPAVCSPGSSQCHHVALMIQTTGQNLGSLWESDAKMASLIQKVLNRKNKMIAIYRAAVGTSYCVENQAGVGAELVEHQPNTSGPRLGPQQHMKQLLRCTCGTRSRDRWREKNQKFKVSFNLGQQIQHEHGLHKTLFQKRKRKKERRNQIYSNKKIRKATMTGITIISPPNETHQLRQY